MKRTTMADVARRAGTSTAAVSYVLNPGTRPVSDDLRQRVLSAVSELDYRPDRHARALRRQRRWGVIGLIVPDVTLPLYGALGAQLERQGRARRQLVVTGNTGFDPTVEVELVESLIESGVDALMAASAVDEQMIAGLSAQAQTRVVWVHNTRHASGYPIVGSDHVAAGRLAADHLLNVHQSQTVAFVGGFADEDAAVGDRETVRDRYRGYAASVGERAVHIKTDLTLDGAYAAVAAHIASGASVDGVVVGTYSQTAAVLRAITDAGLRIPQDVALVSFDRDPASSYDQIVLSTVQQRIGAIASTALDLALRTTEPSAAQVFPVELSSGESCGCPKP